MHGRVEGRRRGARCPGCDAPGEFKAPLQPANFDGPGAWRFLCLDHVREHNAKYNFFEGMSAEEIQEAQVAACRLGAPSRRFAANGADPPPKWSDFADPLDAISGRFGKSASRARRRGSASRSGGHCPCLGLGEDADRHQLRQRYSGLVRRYHPDKNGGDRSHEGGSAK